VRGSSRLLEVGQAVQPFNNWPFYAMPHVSLPIVREGQRVLRELASGWYVLLDEHKIVDRSASNSVFNRGELVRVRLKGAVAPVGRTYDVSPYAVRVDGLLCRDIAVEGIRFEGDERVLSCGLVDGLVLQDLSFVGYRHLAADITQCSRVVASDLYVGPSPGGQGTGYGIQFTRCRNTLLKDSVLDSWAAVKFHSGAMDGVVEDCVIGRPGNAVDAHGFDERRISIRRVSGVGGISLGNDAWLAGGEGHAVEDCDLDFLFVGPGVSSLSVRRSVFRSDGVSFSTIYSGWTSPLSNPSWGRPSGVVLEDSFFARHDSPFQPSLWIDADVVSRRCTFSATGSDWGSVVKLRDWAQGSLVFDSCEFLSANAREIVDISTGLSAGLRFVARDCEFRSSASGSDVAVLVRAPFVGSLELIRNRFYATQWPASFVVGSTKADCVSKGNVVVRP
jgi:hypothetical protein